MLNSIQSRPTNNNLAFKGNLWKECGEVGSAIGKKVKLDDEAVRYTKDFLNDSSKLPEDKENTKQILSVFGEAAEVITDVVTDSMAMIRTITAKNTNGEIASVNVRACGRDFLDVIT